MERRLLTLVRRAAGDPRSDADLLARLDDHEAFAELVARHGPLVWGVCRNLLSEADAEDAFQATFLALLRSRVRNGAALAAWLHRVAVSIALSIRREEARRRKRERRAAALEAVPPPDDWGDALAAVHQEIAALPEADRIAFVACVLEGLTQAEAAVRLGRTPGAVAGQVARAKKRLVVRLTGRGSAFGLAALGTTSVAGGVPPELVSRALGLPGSASPTVRNLTAGVLGMARTKFATVALIGIAVSVGAWFATAGPPAHVDPPVNQPVAVVADRDWPMGGRTGDRNPVSPEKNAPTDWTVPSDGATGQNVRWSARVGSEAIGGPVISGGLVWVGTNNATAPGLPDFAVLACYRESDGKLLSRYRSPRRGDGVERDWPQQSLSGSPLAEGDRLWFCTNRREVVCLDVGPLRRGTGEPNEVWKLDLVKELNVAPRPLMFPGHDFLGSPAAYKGFLYVPTGNGTAADGKTVPAPDAPALACLRKDTGKVVWADHAVGRNVLHGHSASPLVVEIGGRGQVIHPQADGWVRAFDAETGKLVWELNCNRPGAKGDRGLGAGGKRVYVLGTPVYAAGRVYFGTGTHAEVSGSDPGRLFCVDPTGTGDVSPETDDGTGAGKKNPNSAVVWEYTRDDPKDGFHLMMSSVAIHAGLVYAADFYGHVHCLDAKTGERHWWHDAKSHIFGHPLVVDGKVYVATDEGRVLVFAVGKTKRLLATNELERVTVAPPVFANGVLYLLTRGQLFAVAAPAPREVEPRPKAAPDAKLLGEWRVVSAKQTRGPGEPNADIVEYKDSVWVFDESEVAVKQGKEGYTFGYRLDPVKEPKEIDLGTGAKGPVETRPYEGIYEVDGDKLTVAYTWRAVRPVDFDMPRGLAVTKSLVVLERVKAAPKERPVPKAGRGAVLWSEPVRVNWAGSAAERIGGVWAPDGKSVLVPKATMSARGEPLSGGGVEYRDALTGAVTKSLDCPVVRAAFQPTALAVAADGKTVVAHGAKYEPGKKSEVTRGVVIWRDADRERVDVVTDTGSPNGPLALADDGKRFAALSHKGELEVRETAGRRLLSSTNPKLANGDRVTALWFHPSGEFVLAGTLAGDLLSVNAQKGGRGGTAMAGTKVAVRAVAAAPDRELTAVGGAPVGAGGAALVVASEPRFAEDFRRFADAVPARERINGLAFAPDGRHLAAACSDGILRVFDVGTGKLAASAKEHTGELFAVAFAPDGKTLLTVGKDAIKVWDVPRLLPPK